MANPTAIKRAKKMAEDAAGRTLSYENVWIEKHGGAWNEYQVRFVVPKASGLFICNAPLYLEAEEFEEYEAWNAEQEI